MNILKDIHIDIRGSGYECDELIAPLAKGINLSVAQLQTIYIQTPRRDEAPEMMGWGVIQPGV